MSERKRVNVICEVLASVSATFDLGENETIEDFEKWFRKKVTARVELSDCEETITESDSITDLQVEVI